MYMYMYLRADHGSVMVERSIRGFSGFLASAFHAVGTQAVWMIDFKNQ